MRLLDSLTNQFTEKDVRGVYALVRDTVDSYGQFQSLFDSEHDLR